MQLKTREGPKDDTRKPSDRSEMLACEWPTARYKNQYCANNKCMHKFYRTAIFLLTLVSLNENVDNVFQIYRNSLPWFKTVFSCSIALAFSTASYSLKTATTKSKVRHVILFTLLS